VQIIYANVSTREKQPMSLSSETVAPLSIHFTYSVRWHRTRWTGNLTVITIISLLMSPGLYCFTWLWNFSFVTDNMIFAVLCNIILFLECLMLLVRRPEGIQPVKSWFCNLQRFSFGLTWSNLENMPAKSSSKVIVMESSCSRLWLYYCCDIVAWDVGTPQPVECW